MNTETTQAKCRCRNCDGHIEFDPSAAGQTATCPHCGMDTVLFVPGAPVRLPPPPAPKNYRLLFIVGGLSAGLVLLICFFRLLIHSAAAQQATLALGGGLLGLALIALVALIVILWLLFPVFVYFAIGRFEKLLTQIERNTRL